MLVVVLGCLVVVVCEGECFMCRLREFLSMMLVMCLVSVLGEVLVML